MDTKRERTAADRLVWGLVLVLVVATLLRTWNISTLSMWEDEEGSLARAQHPFHGYAGFFPVFFVSLNQLLQVTGISVGIVRVLPALAGLLSIALAYFCFRRWVSPVVALMAAMFIAVNMGHVFWSQSIRYYTTALVFQMLSVHWFFDGFERNRVSPLILASVALMFALLTHFSAVLLVPALVGYLIVGSRWGEPSPGYRMRNYLVFGITQAVLLGLFGWRILQMRNMIGGWAIPSARDPVHVGTTVVAYFGVPLIILGILSPWLARELPRRVLLLLCCISLVPVLELLVIAKLDVINVTWYYALIALIGFALLGGASLVGLWRRGHRAGASVMSAVCLVYYCAFLWGYHTTMHGDRPRWEEAAKFLKQEVGIRAGEKDTPPVYASVPGVVAFYLGTDPRQPESYEVVQAIPRHPADGEGWYVVEAKLVTPRYQTWFEGHCILRAQFKAKTGPVDRSVLVYQHRARPIPPSLGAMR